MLLRVDRLRVQLDASGRPLAVVDDVSLGIEAGQTVALVGESGCGKTLTALAVLRLLPAATRVAGGRVMFDGRDLLTLPEGELQGVRGDRIAMIFQEAMTCLNPVLPIGDQIAEPLRVHRGLPVRAARRRAVELLRRVGIADAERRASDHPHQFSGGMQQRVMIAMSLACEPALLIADEPTTALDVTIQAQIIALLRDLQQQCGLAILFITHDLPLVAEFAEHVYVMYAGRIVEHAPAARLFASPRHPYTQALLRSVLTLAEGSGFGVQGSGTMSGAAAPARPRLPVVPGEVPTPARRPSGCAFHPRCPLGRDDAQCRTQSPPLDPVDASHSCACWKAERTAATAFS